LQVGDVGRFQLGLGDAIGTQPGHAMHAFAVEDHGVVQRQFDAFGKFALAVRQTGQAALAGRPVAGRQIEQHLLDSGRLEPFGDVMGRPVVGKKVFDAAKSGFSRPLETGRER